MRREHTGDLAELYALGALSEIERRAVEAHLSECADCAREVALAERDVALIASLETRHDAPPELAARIDGLFRANRPNRMIPAALAAVLILGLLPSVYLWPENRRMHDAMVAQNAAMDRLASGSHRTVGFRSEGAPLGAEVMYPPDGSWYVVVVRNATKALQVAWMHDGERTMLGNAVPRGNVAMLYLPKSHRMDRLALMDGDRVVAEAELPWQRTPPDRPTVRSE